MRAGFLVTLLSILFACGPMNDVSTVREATPALAASASVAFVITGSLAGVRALSQASDTKRSAIDIAYELACNESLTTFTHTTLDQGNSGYRVLVSAVGTRTVTAEPCVGDVREVRSIVLPTTISGPEQIELIQLSGSEAPVPRTTAAWSALQEFEVASVRPLCTPGTTCVTDGTIVSLRTTLKGCFDRLGPVTFAKLARNKTERDAGLRVAVSGVELADRASQNVYCLVPNSPTTEIVLLDEFVTKATLGLIVVHRS